MVTQQRHLLVAGASGVIGTGAVAHFGALPDWSVTALSRRAPIVPHECRFTHVPLDLADRDDCRRAVASLPPVTHLIYAAAKEGADLAAGWRDAALIADNGRMFAHLLDPLLQAGSLHHVILLQGAKAYGAHRHPVAVPAKEDRPRDDHPNFYWVQEDHARLRAAEAGFAMTVFRPQVVLGSAPGVAMNPMLAIGAQAALCRELGRPFALPGSGETLLEMVDTALLAEAFGWAFGTPQAANNETFNITNGDVLVLGHSWAEIAAALDLADGGVMEGSFAARFAEPASTSAWVRLAERHDLRIRTLPALLGASHQYTDLLLGPRIAAKTLPVLLSTIKLRQAGFAGCRDSVASLLHGIDRMVALKILPPF